MSTPPFLPVPQGKSAPLPAQSEKAPTPPALAPQKSTSLQTPVEELSSWIQEVFGADASKADAPSEGAPAPPSTPSANASAPEVIPEGLILDNRYRLLGIIGKGGMGAVYKAEHLLMGKPVAIKLLKKEVASSPEVVLRFTREAQLASRLQDPHCVAVHDFGQTPDRSLYLVMEYLEGEGLRTRLKRVGRLPLERAHDIISQILEALEAAHDKKIVHRDIKPENIMLVQQGDRSDYVKILDFGIARAAESLEPRLTQTSLAVGTPGYMAPEQAVGKGEPDARADLYSAAVIFYEMLCGRRPFAADSEMAEVTNQMVQSPPSPKTIHPQLEIPAALEAVLMRALSRDPRDRFSSALEMRQAIHRAIGRKPRPLRNTSTSATLEALSPALPAQRLGPLSRTGIFLDSQLTPLFTRGFWVELRHGGWRDLSRLASLALGALLFLALVLVLSYFLFPKSSEPPPASFSLSAPAEELPLKEISPALSNIVQLYQKGEFAQTLGEISKLSPEERQTGIAQRVLALAAAEVGEWEEVRPAFRAAMVLNAITEEDRATLLRQGISALAGESSASARRFLARELGALEGLAAATKDSDKRRRKAAIEGLLEVDPGGRDLIPFYLDALEAAQDCRERLPLVEALIASGDERAYPALKQEQNRGIGVFEPNHCMASPLSKAIKEWEEAQNSPR